MRRRKRKTGRRRSSGKPVRIAGVNISHPDKPFWPAHSGFPALTKSDLARYMAAVAPRMLPHVAKRPISILRAPDGIHGERFFQRHVLAGTAAPMLAMKPRGSTDEPFLAIRNARALVALAQAGVIEIHPWGCRPGKPLVPERIVFDLDPAPDLRFERVVEAALDIARGLRGCGLVPFVKTTGGKGLHVVTPIAGKGAKPPSWTDARLFAKALCRFVAAERPGRYTTNPLQGARRGKVYLDYLRNAKGASAVAPWSPRARAGAPIAVPLRWNQLRTGLDPHRFTIATSRALLRKPDPWNGLARSARSLPHAMEKLLRRAAKVLPQKSARQSRKPPRAPRRGKAPKRRRRKR